ncbi:MAG TPA: molybdenum cofactor biosynthesis protein MoaE [Gemmatimonadales bacterium]|nr:molybdenum cofactor biosynthesis protein MoaE [Gemmatimonadales bacterium]
MTYLTRDPIDAAALLAEVAARGHGGISLFVGAVRDHQDGRGVIRLEYSAYEPMAEAECRRIVDEALGRWPVAVALRHRIGELAVGDVAVAVAAGSAHRDEAFAACRYVIEEVKRRVPIWKKEFYADGHVEWVDPTARRPEAPAAALAPGANA